MYQKEERSYIDSFQDDGTHIQREYKRTALNTNEALKKHVAAAVGKWYNAHRRIHNSTSFIRDWDYQFNLSIKMIPLVLPATIKQLKEDCYLPEHVAASHGKSLLRCVSDACEEFQSQFNHRYDFDAGFPQTRIMPMDKFYEETACNPMVGTLDGAKALTNRSFGRMKELLQQDADATARLAWWYEDRFIAWDFESDMFLDECGYPYSPSNEHRQCTDWVIRTSSL